VRFATARRCDLHSRHYGIRHIFATIRHSFATLQPAPLLAFRRIRRFRHYPVVGW